jgi:predicted N-formylglutamate amidohydrolase
VAEAETRPFEVVNERGRAPVVLVVDHASNFIPPVWGDLGLGEAERAAHIAWDPGALPVARFMSGILDAPLFHGTVSRLVLDLNRPTGSATLIPEVSETTTIPGNKGLGSAERERRIAAVYEPYHAALENLIDAQIQRAGGPVAVVAVHTFTPVYRGVARHLHVGILFDRDERLARGLLRELAAEPGLRAEPNQPYSPADEVYWTLDRHAVSRGLPNVMIEIRNDEVRTEDAQRLWAERLAGAIARIMGTTAIGTETPQENGDRGGHIGR